MEDPRDKKINKDRWDLDCERLRTDKYFTPHRHIKNIEEVIPAVMENLSKPIQPSVVILRDNWRNLWEETLNKEMGPKYAEHSQPGFIKDYNLCIFVFNSSWLSEFEINKSILLDKIKTSYDSLNIRKIYFSLN